MKKSVYILVGIALAFAILFVNLSYVGPSVLEGFRYNDFAHFYVSARLFSSGSSVYGVPLEPLMQQAGFINEPAIEFATNPPGLLLITGVLLFFSPLVAFVIWTLSQVALAWISAYLFARKLNPVTSVQFFLILSIAMGVSRGFHSHLEYGQVQLLLLSLLAGGYCLALSEHALVRGIGFGCIGLTTGVKLFTWPLIGFCWYRAGYKGALCFLSGAAVLNALAVLWGGFSLALEFIQLALPYVHSTAYVYTSNLALPHALVWSAREMGILHDIRSAQLLVSSLIQVVAAMLMIPLLRSCKTRQLAPAQVFAVFICLSVLSAPTVWPHYLVLFVVPFIVLIQTASSGKPLGLLCCWALLALANGRNPQIPVYLQMLQVWVVPILACLLLFWNLRPWKTVRIESV